MREVALIFILMVVSMTFGQEPTRKLKPAVIDLYGEISEYDMNLVLTEVWSILDDNGMTLDDFVPKNETTPANMWDRMLDIDPDSLFYEVLEYRIMQKHHRKITIYFYVNSHNTGFIIEKGWSDKSYVKMEENPQNRFKNLFNKDL